MNDEEKMTIQSKKYRGETAVVSARLPGDLVSAIDVVAKETGRTRNEIMQLCLEFAIDKVEIEG